MHVLAAALAACTPAALGAPPTAPSAERREALVHMVRQDCGSCHGLTLKGGLGPALEPRLLAEKDADQLRQVILHGRPGTPMPPWNPFVTEEEVRWIVEMLKSGFPDAR
jgi:cytochrome c55X